MAAIKAVFFDVGGVIIDADLERYLPLGCALFQCAPQNLEREVALRVPMLETGKTSSAEFWKSIGETLWRRGEGKIAASDDYLHIWEDLMRASLRLNVQVVEICKSLRECGYKVGLLTNAIEEHAMVLSEVGVYAPFDPVVVSCRIGMRKPEPGIYKLAAEKAQLNLNECLFVDDIKANVEASVALGMVGIHFTDAEALCMELVKRGMFNKVA